MRTSSLWGTPPSRFYTFLAFIEKRFDARPLQLAILGCSDGKFVVPSARRGHQVLALDIDAVALFGGEKIGPSGKVYMPGLLARLKAENLENQVQVVLADFVEYKPSIQYHGVFTSGAIQYSRNLEHPIGKIIESVQDYIIPSGYLYVDYMLPMEEKYNGRENYPGKSEWGQFFSGSDWRVLYNRVLPPVFEKAHVDNPIDHYHHWGHLLAQKA